MTPVHTVLDIDIIYRWDSPTVPPLGFLHISIGHEHVVLQDAWIVSREDLDVHQV